MKNTLALEMDSRTSETSVTDNSDELPAEDAIEVTEKDNKTPDPIAVIYTESDDVSNHKRIVGTIDDDMPEKDIYNRYCLFKAYISTVFDNNVTS